MEDYIEDVVVKVQSIEEWNRFVDFFQKQDIEFIGTYTADEWFSQNESGCFAFSADGMAYYVTTEIWAKTLGKDIVSCDEFIATRAVGLSLEKNPEILKKLFMDATENGNDDQADFFLDKYRKLTE